MVVTREQIARRLRSARKDAGLSQSAVASSLGLHRPAISEIEAARRAVGAEELHELSRLYRVPVSTLLSGTGEPVPGALESAQEHTRVGRALAEITKVIVERFHPERIVLFGSHARGTAGPDSDLDILVVMDVPGARRKTAAEIGAALHGIPMPKDIIVTTPDQFEWRQKVAGTLERSAALEGKVLYERG